MAMNKKEYAASMAELERQNEGQLSALTAATQVISELTAEIEALNGSLKAAKKAGNNLVDTANRNILRLEHDIELFTSSLPRVKHDAIMRVAEYGCQLMANGQFGKSADRMKEDAANILTQAKEDAQ